MARDPYRRQVRRAHRTLRRRRGDPLQLVILGPPDSLGLIALAVISRWAYRHRTAFVPFGIVGAAYLLAASTHPHHARYWLLTAGITILATVMLAIPHGPSRRGVAAMLRRARAACGIDRGIERAYAAMVIAATGGWLAAAIAAGPAAKPLPATAVTGTLALSVPWWFHRRRRAKARVEKTISAWPDVADNAGLPGSEILSVVVDAWGWTARVLLRKGITTEQVIRRIPALESGLKLKQGSMRVFPDGTRADKCVVRVIEADPREAVIPWPGPSAASITRPVDIGISEDGRAVRVLLLRRNALVGGIMGSGKSGILNVIIATLAACPDVVLWGVDLKGGMEFEPWAACFDRLAVTPQQADELFRDAVGFLNWRARQNAQAGKRLHDPAPDDPALVIITDEHSELHAEAHECADSISRRGRAVAVNLIAATQRPTQVAMGRVTSVRSQMDVRICLRVREPRDVDLIIGQRASTTGWQTHRFTQPGEFLISDPEHTVPQRHRAYLITDEQVTQHAAQCAPGRPRLAADESGAPRTAPEPPQTAGRRSPRTDDRLWQESALWDALSNAGLGGVPTAELLAITGMTRPTLYRHLRDHARAGRAAQVTRGHWRATRPPGGAPGHGRPPGRRDTKRPPGRDGQ